MLRCDHPSFTIAYVIQWYRILPGKGPDFLITGYQDTPKGKLTIIFGDEKKYSFLGIQSIKPEDSSLYLCVQTSTETYIDFLPVHNVIIQRSVSMMTSLEKKKRVHCVL
ncbi:hypothetical protein GDO81_001836 [Engystomops pustulosus]|uniref:Ig-like domain-containing protein n=1 Tax=Engystomops pustulosus TaxID=76066 RepID=A0AAV7DH54_ENGPU|nr:hypothetical protein GDO81_001836 [Engystomops pustulosus]